MAFPATSSMVVDISGDDDNAGALAAASAIPSTNMDSTFERSCDNPECSAPKLISLVPKREAPEFITEPMIMSQPTLINGFTTVFQIDGIGAKMNDIMYGESGSGTGASNSNGTPSKPRSVFRIVPNTHAHIVNYVVVDGAGETMRKIKANDTDTMRKLLDSQRLSAEQMLKKLIGKAFKTPARQNEPQVPQPISSKTLVFASPSAPISAPTPVPMSAPLPASVLPIVPPGITITPIPMPELLQSGKPNTASTSSPTTTVIRTVTTNVASPNQASTSTNSPPTVSTPILRQALVTTPSDEPKTSGRPAVLKRKLVSTPIPDTIKKLRPRSPRHKTPMAVGLNPLSPTPPPTKKLPTLPKLPTKPPTMAANALVQSTPQPNKDSPTKGTESIEEDEASISETSSTKGTEKLTSKVDVEASPKTSAAASTKSGVLPTQKSTSVSITKNLAANPTTPASKSLPVKPKPLMGPASRMNALKAIAAAKANATLNASNTEAAGKQSTAVASTKIVTRIGETVITSTVAPTSNPDATPLPKTKPCSVSIPKADISNAIFKTKEAINKEIGASTPKEDAAPASKPNVTELTSKTDTKSTQSASKTNVATISKRNMISAKAAVRSSPETERLANAAPKPSLTSKGYLLKSSVAASNSKGNVSKVDGPPNTRTSMGLPSKANTSKVDATTPTGISTSKSDGPLNTKIPSTPKSDTTSVSKTDGPLSKNTRASTPKAHGPLPTKSDKISTPTTKTSAESPKTSETPSRMLRVVLPTLKNGVMTIPARSPHPNLKISSVISGGSAVAALGVESRSPATKVLINKPRGPDIEKLQQELLDLRRTVARLTKKT